MLQKKSVADHPDISTFYDRLVPTLITKTVLALTTPVEEGSKANPTVLADDSVLEVTGRLVTLVVRSLDAIKQERVLQDAFDLFIVSKPSGLILRNREKVAEIFKPFGISRVSEYVPCMTIFTCIVAGMRNEVRPHIISVCSFGTPELI